MGLVEVIVAVTLATLAIAGSITAFSYYLRIGLTVSEKIQATYLAEEGLEVMRFFRDESWENIATLASSTSYYLSFGGSSWSTTTTLTLINDRFERVILLEDVYRRTSDDDIVASTSLEAKTLDPNIRKVTARVLWSVAEGSEVVEVATYIADIFSD